MMPPTQVDGAPLAHKDQSEKNNLTKKTAKHYI